MSAPVELDGWVKATCSKCWGTGEIYPAVLKSKLAVNPIRCPLCKGGDIADPGIWLVRGESGKLSGEPDPPSALQGAFEYLQWLESDMRFDKWFDVPFVVRFPLGWNHWMNDSVDGDGSPPSYLDLLRKLVCEGEATGERWTKERRREQREEFTYQRIPFPVAPWKPEPDEPELDEAEPDLLAALSMRPTSE